MKGGDISNIVNKKVIIDGNILFNYGVPDYDYIRKVNTVFMDYNLILFISADNYDEYILKLDDVEVHYDNIYVDDYQGIVEYSIRKDIMIYTSAENFGKFSGRGILLSSLK